MNAARPLTERATTTFSPLDDCQAEAFGLLGGVARNIAHAPPRMRPARGLLGRIRQGLATLPAPVTGLYLWGGVGRGKTHLMDAFFASVTTNARRRVHFHHFMQEVHEALADLPPQPDPLEVLADRIATDIRLLCLDEFVVTDITDAMILHGLLKAFFARGITLVTTSNTPPDQLYANGLQRERFLPAIALLKQHTRDFNLDAGTDYRLRALRQADVYFSPLDNAADQGMARHFANLSGGHADTQNSLSINHRDIAVRRLAPGVVWLDFPTLCEGPRATSDYIEIAREFHTLLLSDIPRLTPSLDAAARRFLHLVDELYDRNVKLIAAAAVPIEQLYDGKELAFEYQRLRSRLTEMRSVDYLARPHLPL